MDNNQFNQNTVMEQFESNFNKKRSPLAKTIIIAVVAVMCIGGFLFYQEMQKVHINLNRYLEVRVSGFDGYGNVRVSFDGGQLVEDYAAELDVESLIEYDWVKDYLEDCVEYEVIAPDELKNGDTVTVKWKVDKKNFEKKYNCRLEYETKTVPVTDLEDFVEYDPFKDFEVSFEGTAPYATVSLDDYNVEYSFLDFDIDKTENLRNGDVVTITLKMDEDFEENCISNGVIITNTKKEYTVSGLASYVEKIEDIPEDGMNSMKGQAEDAFNAYVAKEWENPESMKGFNYIGSYFLTRKEYDSWESSNCLFLVYEVSYDGRNVNEENEEENKEEIKEPFTYYYYVCFYDLVVLDDGTFSVDLNNYEKSDNRWAGQRFDKYGLSFNGYENKESMFSHCVTENVENYNYESTVSE